MRKFFVCAAFLEVLFIAQLGSALDRQPNADYRARRQALAGKTNGGVVLLFAPTEAEGPNAVYGYRPDSDFFYLSGWAEPGAALLIAPAVEAKGKDPARAYTDILFLPAHNYAEEKWTGPKLGPDNPQASNITGFDHVEVLDRMRDELARLLPPMATIYTDVPAAGETSNSRAPLEWLSRANAFPLRLSFQDLRPLLASLRTYKDAGEMDRIRKAVNASIAAHFAAMRTVKPGMSEREVSALMQYEWGKRGCERPAYAPIVGSGFNSTVLHYSDDSGPIQSGDVVVMDAAGEYSLYASDITRTLPATGKFTARQREIYDIVLGAQRAAIAAFQSGKSHLRRDQPNSIHNVAYEYIYTHCKDLHDAGDYDAPLAPGMVFTIEPGIYIPEEKLGVRIEDMYYVDASGKLIELTEELPHTADEVEHAMAAR